MQAAGTLAGAVLALCHQSSIAPPPPVTIARAAKHNSDHYDVLLLKLDKYDATCTVGGLDNERIEPLRSEGERRLRTRPAPESR